MKNIKSMSLPELEEYLLSLGEKKFRAKQIFSWLHKVQVGSFDEMTNLSKELREKLKKECSMPGVTKLMEQVSQEDGTRKYLFTLEDGNVIETVLMRYHHGNSVCVSSQVGCRMGCKFCASTLDGMVRGLEASEILDQVYEIQRELGEVVNHVVIMGSGEPMDNYDQVVRFLRLISHPDGQNMSQRNITVSTCGLVPQMKQFAEEGLQVTLALSLHASDDETRKKLMPIANAYTIKEVLSACDYYFEKTGRRVTYEYSLVRDVNDNVKEANALAALLKGKNCHVNLIPVNPIKERDFHQPGAENIQRFKKVLAKYGINVTIRREMGRDIDGACGQLRKRFNDQVSGEEA